MARPPWDPTKTKDEGRWLAATGLLNRVNACYATLKRVDDVAPKDKKSPGEILEAFLRIRREELKAAANAFAVPSTRSRRMKGLWASDGGQARGDAAPGWLAEQPENRNLYIEGFRWAALHVAEYRRAKKKREPGHLDLKEHAYAMAAAVAAGHDYGTGLPDLADTPFDHRPAAEAARKLFNKAGARYRKGPPKP